MTILINNQQQTKVNHMIYCIVLLNHVTFFHSIVLLLQIASEVVMNDSEQEGFYEPIIQTFTQSFRRSSVCKINPSKFQIKIKPALCVHYQLSLYQYPQQMDRIDNLCPSNRIVPPSNEVLAPIIKKQDNNIALSEYFPRNFQCLYNKFREKVVFKRDLTLIIRNVTRLVRDEQVITFDSNRQASSQQLAFSSDFQGGNLQFVFKQRKQETYYLLLQNDVNTHGFNFWFYFNVRSQTQKKCNFVIVNLSRPVCFENDAAILTYTVNTGKFERKTGFITALSQFCRCDKEQNYWSLFFEYEFDHDSQVYFSLTLPYSYSKVIRMLKKLNEQSQKFQQFFIQTAAKSPIGNIVPSIRILKQHRNVKKVILITARQHPCETVSSYVCESIIRILCEKNEISDALLQRFRFIILPMVNVDGVIHGNSRTNLAGYDLNRCWDRSGIIQSIQCEQIWKYLQNIQADSKIVWAFDLHGHSREHGFFAYFCENNDKSLILTHHLAAKSSIFAENKCCYEIGYNKRQSIRGQLYQRMKIRNAVTIEVSLFGYYDQNKQFVHFQSRHFNEIANSLLSSLLQTEKMSQKHIIKQKNWQQLIKRMQISHNEKDKSEKDIDSDSNPEGDYLKKQERKQVDQEIQQFQFKLPEKNKNEPKQQPSNMQNVSSNKRFKTQVPKQQKCKSQRSSPLKHQNPIKIQLRRTEKERSPDLKQKIQRQQIFNITFRNRFHSSQKNINKSQQLTNCPQITNIWYDSRKNEKVSNITPSKTQNYHFQSDPELKRSLDMRKKIKIAFQNQHKTQRGIYISNLINQSTSKITAIVYPMIKEKRKSDYQSNLKSKKQLTKQLRNQSYGISLHNRFQNSLYLKGKNQ